MIEKGLVFSGQYFRIKGMEYLRALIRHYSNKAKKFNYSKSVMIHCEEEIDLIIEHLNKHKIDDMRDEAIKLKKELKNEATNFRSSK